MWSRKTNCLLFSFSFWIAHGSYSSSTYTISSLTQGTTSAISNCYRIWLILFRNNCRWAGPHLLSLTHPLSITLSQFYSITHSLSLFLSLSLSYSLSLSLSYSISLSHSLPLSLYLSLTLSPTLPLFLTLSRLLSMSLSPYFLPYLSFSLPFSLNYFFWLLRYLLTLADHIHSCRFGTFLFDSDSERVRFALHNWDYKVLVAASYFWLVVRSAW